MEEDLRPSQIPQEIILWHGYTEIIPLLKKKPPAVFLFVLDYDGTRFPFLREIFSAMPRNEKLRKLLNGPCPGIIIKPDSLPEYMRNLGAGSNYHLAILSPVGLTPLVTFDYMTGQPQTLVAQIADALEAVAKLDTSAEDSEKIDPPEKSTSISELFQTRFNELMAEGDFSATHFAASLLAAKGLSAGKAEAVVQRAVLRVIQGRDNEPGKMPQPEDLKDLESFRKYFHTLIAAVVDSMAPI